MKTKFDFRNSNFSQLLLLNFYKNVTTMPIIPSFSQTQMQDPMEFDGEDASRNPRGRGAAGAPWHRVWRRPILCGTTHRKTAFILTPILENFPSSLAIWSSVEFSQWMVSVFFSSVLRTKASFPPAVPPSHLADKTERSQGAYDSVSQTVGGGAARSIEGGLLFLLIIFSSQSPLAE